MTTLKAIPIIYKANPDQYSEQLQAYVVEASDLGWQPGCFHPWITVQGLGNQFSLNRGMASFKDDGELMCVEYSNPNVTTKVIVLND